MNLHRAIADLRVTPEATVWISSAISIVGGGLLGFLVVTPHEWMVRQESGYTTGPWLGGAVFAYIAMHVVRKTTTWRTVFVWTVFASAMAVLFLGTLSESEDPGDPFAGRYVEEIFQPTNLDRTVAFVRSFVALLWGVFVGRVTAEKRAVT